MKKKPQRTAQRSAICDFIKDNKSHPSVKEIYQHVSEQLPNISMTTVYNTMELMKKEGLVQEIAGVVHGEGRRYDSNVAPHDHLICMSCGKVIDIEVGVDHSLLLTEDQQQRFDIKKISINVYGQCPDCKRLRASGTSNT